MTPQRIGTLIGIIAACILIAVSASMNVAFLSGLGRTALERVILGAASGAADALKALLPLFIVTAWRDQKRTFAIPACMVWTLFVGFSFMSAIGFAAANRIETATAQNHLNAALIAEEQRQRDLLARHQGLDTHRAIDVISAEIDRYLQNGRWAATKACRNATVIESKRYCAGYFSLQTERAIAQQAADLQKRLAVGEKHIAELRRQGAGQAVDPQAILLAKLIGAAPEDTRLAVVLLLAVVVEVGSSLGLFLATAHRHRKPQHDLDSSDNTVVQLDNRRTVLPVEDWALARLIPQHDGVLSLAEAHADYVAVCQSQRMDAAEFAAFDNALTEIATHSGITMQDQCLRDVALSIPQKLQLPPGQEKHAA